jgi:hypothetical protein
MRATLFRAAAVCFGFQSAIAGFVVDATPIHTAISTPAKKCVTITYISPSSAGKAIQKYCALTDSNTARAMALPSKSNSLASNYVKQSKSYPCHVIIIIKTELVELAYKLPTVVH